MLRELPPVTGVPPLNDEVFARLRRKHPGVLPTRPLDQLGGDCRTCNGTGQFTWLADPAKGIVPVVSEIPKLGFPGEMETVYSVPELPEFAEYRCVCWQQFRLQAYLLAHNIGKAGARATWGDAAWVRANVLEPLREYAEHCADWASRGTGLFLYSLYGTGKSHVANMILKAFLGAGVEGYWITFNEMLTMHTSSWRDKEARDWFESRVRNAQVLVIDDIGKESAMRPIGPDGNPLPTNWAGIAATALDSLFRARVQNGMVTIITANMPPDQIALNYTPALGSLATEACLPYRFPDQDIRTLIRERILAEGKHKLTRPFTLA